MGIGPKISRSVYDTPASAAPVSPNPDPKRYQIINWATFFGHLILELRYLDATNYEGRKLLLFDKDVTLQDLRKQSWGIDPHFSDTIHAIHPIARFEPTERGWEMAIRAAAF